MPGASSFGAGGPWQPRPSPRISQAGTLRLASVDLTTLLAAQTLDPSPRAGVCAVLRGSTPTYAWVLQPR